MHLKYPMLLELLLACYKSMEPCRRSTSIVEFISLWSCRPDRCRDADAVLVVVMSASGIAPTSAMFGLLLSKLSRCRGLQPCCEATEHWREGGTSTQARPA
jgi:hypothetical protein